MPQVLTVERLTELLQYTDRPYELETTQAEYKLMQAIIKCVNDINYEANRDHEYD